MIKEGENLYVTEEEFQKAVESKPFREFEKVPKWKQWLTKKAQRIAFRNQPGMKRHLRIHEVAKAKVFRLGLKIMRKVLGKYMIKGFEDIPSEPYNNLLRMIYWSFNKGLDDMWRYLHWNLPNRIDRKKFKTPEEWIRWCKETKYWSDDRRRAFVNIWFTEVLEDTADREWWNMFALNLWHQMNEYFGGDVPKPGEFPVYTQISARHIEYFLVMNKMKLWQPPKEGVEELKNE